MRAFKRAEISSLLMGINPDLSALLCTFATDVRQLRGGFAFVGKRSTIMEKAVPHLPIKLSSYGEKKRRGRGRVAGCGPRARRLTEAKQKFGGQWPRQTVAESRLPS